MSHSCSGTFSPHITKQITDFKAFISTNPSFPQTLANGTTNSVLLIFLSLKIQASKESNSFSHNFSERSESKAEKAIARKLEFM